MTHMNVPIAAKSPPSKKLTFEEYLFYQGEPDVLYELYQGTVIPRAAPTALHIDICRFLVYHIQRYVATKELDLVAVTKAGVRTETDGTRIPDVVICSQTVWRQVRSRPGSGVLDFNEVPLLVIEVASDNWREDYIRKRAEYALIDIPEYCIVDPKKDRVRILTNPANEDGYQHTDFVGGQQILFPQFPDLVLSVDEVLSPANVENLIRAEQDQRQQLQQELITERQRADQEHQRAERLVELLRSQGINPKDL
ncbi:Uma2 family endonuclease [Phormidesmis priestleyi]